MQKLLSRRLFSIHIIQILVFLSTVVVLYFAWSLSRNSDVRSGGLVVLPVILLLAGVFAWFTGQQMNLRNKQQELQQIIGDIQSSFPDLQRRLDGAIQLNHRLLDAQDEQGVMDAALKVISDLAYASAVTFVPMDEWGQPLPAYTYGDMPETMLRAWAEHLVSPSVRDRCRTCQVKHALPQSSCPMLEGQFSRAVAIYCVPLRRGDRMLGMLNLHIPADKTISGDLIVFLEGLLHEVALAIQTIRLRNQEFNTLRQLQMMRTSRADRSMLLESLLLGLQQVIEVEVAIIQVKAVEPWRSGESVQKGSLAWLDRDTMQGIYQKTMESGHIESWHELGPARNGSVVAVPLRLLHGPVTGAIVIAGEQLKFGRHEEAILCYLAEQAAMAIENERMLLLLEYKAVVQERTRLAREIHDGLAQTLAFLKMKTSQMQNYLNQGDITRLNQVLQQHYQVLADAYLDTRLAIDNLRQSTHQGLIHWIEQTVTDFEQTSGLSIERKLETLDHDLSPEIHAQLIRIVQEGLSNIRKHAMAHRAWISLRQRNGDLILEIGDDGEGFTPEDVPELTRHGLRGMRERAEFIGADFQIISQPCQGTLVRLRLPLYEETVS